MKCDVIGCYDTAEVTVETANGVRFGMCHECADERVEQYDDLSQVDHEG